MTFSFAVQRRWSAQHTLHALLVAGIVVLDQLSKFLCNSLLVYGQPRPVFPGFDLLLAYNRGAAFSFLDDAGGWQRWILAGVSLVVSAGIAVWLWRLPPRQKLLGLALDIRSEVHGYQRNWQHNVSL